MGKFLADQRGQSLSGDLGHTSGQVVPPDTAGLENRGITKEGVVENELTSVFLVPVWCERPKNEP